MENDCQDSDNSDDYEESEDQANNREYEFCGWPENKDCTYVLTADNREIRLLKRFSLEGYIEMMKVFQDGGGGKIVRPAKHPSSETRVLKDFAHYFKNVIINLGEDPGSWTFYRELFLGEWKTRSEVNLPNLTHHFHF